MQQNFALKTDAMKISFCGGQWRYSGKHILTTINRTYSIELVEMKYLIM